MADLLTNPIAIAAFLCGAAVLYLVVTRTLKRNKD